MSKRTGKQVISLSNLHCGLILIKKFTMMYLQSMQSIQRIQLMAILTVALRRKRKTLMPVCSFQPSDNLPVTFGTNIKAQLSARTAFSLAHKHGDILREGWQNLLVCMLQLFKTKLLPKVLTEVSQDMLCPVLFLLFIKTDYLQKKRWGTFEGPC